MKEEEEKEESEEEEEKEEEKKNKKNCCKIEIMVEFCYDPAGSVNKRVSSF